MASKAWLGAERVVRQSSRLRQIRNNCHRACAGALGFRRGGGASGDRRGLLDRLETVVPGGCAGESGADAGPVLFDAGLSKHPRRKVDEASGGAADHRGCHLRRLRLVRSELRGRRLSCTPSLSTCSLPALGRRQVRPSRSLQRPVFHKRAGDVRRFERTKTLLLGFIRVYCSLDSGFPVCSIHSVPPLIRPDTAATENGYSAARKRTPFQIARGHSSGHGLDVRHRRYLYFSPLAGVTLHRSTRGAATGCQLVVICPVRGSRTLRSGLLLLISREKQ